MDPLPPDPYLALNVPKDATQAQIKSSYRKLALKFHPDKAPDKGDEFHKISVAHELIGEEEARQKYDADVRLHALKKEQMARFGGTYRPDPGVRSAAFDVRGSPRPDFQFQARTAPRFEERRPSGAFPSARASPYVRDEAPDYFSPKYEDIHRRSAPKSTPREEIRKSDSKKAKSDSKQRGHDEAKRQRDQNRGYDRKTKAKVAASVYSDSSDDSDSDVTPRKENFRSDGYVRQKEYKKSDDEYYGRTKRPELGRKSYAEDYIRSSRVDPPPAERGAPPPAYDRKNTRSPSPQPRRARGESNTTKGRTADLRPEFVRRSSARPAERERSSTPEVPRSTRPTPTRRTSGRRSPSPERNLPPKPKLQHAATQPNNIKIPFADADPRSERAQTQDAYREETRVPPHLRRTETAPSKSAPPPKAAKRPAPTPMQSNAPIQSSGLRKMETNEDSGYNTSSPSEDSPQQPPKASYRYVPAEEKSGKYFGETTRSPERERDYERDRDREAPRRPTMPKERASGPPPSRSASYALNDRNSDPEARQSPSSSRRPSLQRDDSHKRTNSARDELPRIATRHRSESHKSPRVPDMQTGFESPRERNRADRPLFGEIPQSRSPVNMTSSDSEYDEVRRGSGRERERRPPMEQTRSYRKQMNNVDSGYASYGPPQPQGRRASEDIEKSRIDGANRYMDENNRPSMRRQATSYAN